MEAPAKPSEYTEGLSIIVLSKDRPDLFEKCAASVPDVPFLKQKILMQHGQDEATPTIAKRYGWKVVGNGKNNSFSFGNNFAVKHSWTSHLLLLNNDAVLLPGTLEALWDRRDHPLIGTIILEPDGRVNHAGMGYYFKNCMPLHYGRGQDASIYFEDRYTPACTFAAVMIARKLWDDLNGLDEAYWYSYEDVDFCARAQERGVMTLIPHDARVVHEGCATRNPEKVDPKNARIFATKWLDTKRLLDTIGIVLD